MHPIVNLIELFIYLLFVKGADLILFLFIFASALTEF